MSHIAPSSTGLYPGQWFVPRIMAKLVGSGRERPGAGQQIADPEACDQMYESLVRIHTNYYKNKYPRLKDTTFTGVTVEDCRMILATDILKQMEDMKKGTWRRLREKFSAKKPEEDSK
ncbi:ubiquinol-cytochrome-c reductase complex assembly factor 2 isoform X2 [Corapipo altera]|nr:ubiquinol-cytochrome-c reductase complex assembly factor 2 isoform X2 [Corapipo altera]